MQSIIIGSLLSYILLVTGLYVGQRSLLYHPDQTIPSPTDYGVEKMHEINIKSFDDVNLHAWWVPPIKGKPTLIYFHGNAGHIGDRAYKINKLVSSGYGALLMSYRYNAMVAGNPSEEALIADGTAAINWLKNKSITSENIILYGESLGSGIAVALGGMHKVKALILEAPYSSIAEVAQDIYWFVPAALLVKDKFNSVKRIGKVEADILIVHGAKDKTIPIKFGQKLYAATSGPSKFILLDQAGHADLYNYGMGEIVFNFIENLD